MMGLNNAPDERIREFLGNKISFKSFYKSG
jgi:hypothetical protein